MVMMNTKEIVEMVENGGCSQEQVNIIKCITGLIETQHSLYKNQNTLNDDVDRTMDTVNKIIKRNSEMSKMEELIITRIIEINIELHKYKRFIYVLLIIQVLIFIPIVLILVK